MRCVGYRQAWSGLDQALSGPALRAHIRETGIAATRQLAKRQITWLRSFAAKGWITQRVVCEAPDAMKQAVAALHRALD
jgi:tRNA dimethylallyltransferase